MNENPTMRLLTNILALAILLFSFTSAKGVAPDSIYLSNIQSVRLYKAGNQLTMPIINLKSADLLELHFDDLDADVKMYYYTYQLCNADWSEAKMSNFDYIKGFAQSRINNYRFSSITENRYTHYQALLPEKNNMPVLSGNYILKVYLDGDTSKLAFTKRVYVLDNKIGAAATINQPYAPQLFNTHQKINLTLNVSAIKNFSPGPQLKVVVLQNNRWDIAVTDWQPTFVRGNELGYSLEERGVFPGGKEWRWLDVRDFRLQSERVQHATYDRANTQVYLFPDVPLNNKPYFYLPDLNGASVIEASRGINPFWESDYGMVHFYLAAPNGDEYTNKDIYLFGQLSNYSFTDSLRMKFNRDKGLYETKLLLKQGFYDYTYIAVDKNFPQQHNGIDGDTYEAENEYTVLVYYRYFTGRHDEVLGLLQMHSKNP